MRNPSGNTMSLKVGVSYFEYIGGKLWSHFVNIKVGWPKKI